jgi:hypothetical protein
VPALPTFDATAGTGAAFALLGGSIPSGGVNHSNLLMNIVQFNRASMKNRFHRILGVVWVGGSLALAGSAQNATTPQPQVVFSRNPYGASNVAVVDYGNSLRLKSLVRDGRLYLSLDDVIALALENNLDIELQRFTPQLAAMDLMRAQGGGTLRGLPLSLRLLPSGVGGPASPLLTNLGGGSSSTLVQGTRWKPTFRFRDQLPLPPDPPFPSSIRPCKGS